MLDLPSADSLARYHQTSTPPAHLWPTCPRKGHYKLLNEKSGQVITGQCGVLTCAACLLPKVLDTGAAIGLAKPDYLVLLTLVGDEWQVIRHRMNRLRQMMTRGRVQAPWAFHVETNPQGSGHHAHMWVHGSSDAVSAIRRLAPRAGMGNFSDARATYGFCEEAGAPLLTYGMKACGAVPTATGAIAPSARKYLDANGGRLVHTTRSFWRDHHGRRLGGIREAIREARRIRGLSGGWRHVGAG